MEKQIDLKKLICENCAAPISLSDSKTRTNCEYCNTIYYVFNNSIVNVLKNYFYFENIVSKEQALISFYSQLYKVENLDTDIFDSKIDYNLNYYNSIYVELKFWVNLRASIGYSYENPYTEYEREFYINSNNKMSDRYVPKTNYKIETKYYPFQSSNELVEIKKIFSENSSFINKVTNHKLNKLNPEDYKKKVDSNLNFDYFEKNLENIFTYLPQILSDEIKKILPGDTFKDLKFEVLKYSLHKFFLISYPIHTLDIKFNDKIIKYNLDGLDENQNSIDGKIPIVLYNKEKQKKKDNVLAIGITIIFFSIFFIMTYIISEGLKPTNRFYLLVLLCLVISILIIYLINSKINTIYDEKIIENNNNKKRILDKIITKIKNHVY